jgi:hypothetical protein
VPDDFGAKNAITYMLMFVCRSLVASEISFCAKCSLVLLGCHPWTRAILAPRVKKKKFVIRLIRSKRRSERE